MIITRLIGVIQEDIDLVEIGDNIELMDIDYRVVDVIVNENEVEYVLEALEVVEPTIEDLRDL